MRRVTVGHRSPGGRHPRIGQSGSPTTSNGPGNHEVKGVRKVPGRRPPEAVGACEGQQAIIPYMNQSEAGKMTGPCPLPWAVIQVLRLVDHRFPPRESPSPALRALHHLHYEAPFVCHPPRERQIGLAKQSDVRVLRRPLSRTLAMNLGEAEIKRGLSTCLGVRPSSDSKIGGHRVGISLTSRARNLDPLLRSAEGGSFFLETRPTLVPSRRQSRALAAG
ncbi:hypothetical protein R1flu_001250 [Riccia fluitans]|uniref:Uncharacterized protein n=1 Tax=Riccia fluitans TaxID=41844 RepID=A0ABD1Y2R5_9MARC